MSKSNHFFGQPLYGQLVNLLDKEKILELSRSKGGERYIKRFDAWTHLVTMLYAVIMRHDSLREISVCTFIPPFFLPVLGLRPTPLNNRLENSEIVVESMICNRFFHFSAKRPRLSEQSSLLYLL